MPDTDLNLTTVTDETAPPCDVRALDAALAELLLAMDEPAQGPDTCETIDLRRDFTAP
jgi:hypothetical protein